MNGQEKVTIEKWISEDDHTNVWYAIVDSNGKLKEKFRSKLKAIDIIASSWGMTRVDKTVKEIIK